MKAPYLESAELTDIGKKRANNEDATLRVADRNIFCVADGMGGAEAGEVASLAVVEALKEAFSARHSTGSETLEGSRLLVREAMVNANAWIHDYGRQHDMAGVGSTAVIMMFDPRDPQRAMVLHAGDSRAYRLRGDTLKRITKDHSLAAEAGVEDENKLGPMFQSMITRAVGVQLTVEPEETAVDVRSGDLFMLCSDGLTRMAPDDVLSKLLIENRNLPLDTLAQLLVDEANDRGGLDNTTVILVRAGEIPEKPAASPEQAKPAVAQTEEPMREDAVRPTSEPEQADVLRRDQARSEDSEPEQEPDSSEPVEDSTDRDLFSEDIEGDTPQSEPPSPITADVEPAPHEHEVKAPAAPEQPDEIAPEPADEVPPKSEEIEKEAVPEPEIEPPMRPAEPEPLPAPPAPEEKEPELSIPQTPATTEPEMPRPAATRPVVEEHSTQKQAVEKQSARRPTLDKPAGRKQPVNTKLVAAAIGAVLIAGASVVTYRARHAQTGVMPPEPALQEPSSEEETTQPPAPATPAARPAPVPTRPPVTPPQPQQLSERDIATMRATLPTKIEGSLQTGEWGDIETHIAKWSGTINGYLSQSGKETIYARWLALWKKAQSGQVDPAAVSTEYRAAVASVCAGAGLETPPSEAVSWNVSPSEKADACCRLLYASQRHLAAGVERMTADATAEADILGNDPVETLDALSRFVGKTDEELARSKAAVKELRGNVERLNAWLRACGDFPIPVESVRMVPGVAAPRIKAAIQTQRTALSNRLSLIPVAVNLRRAKRDLPQADLDALRDMHARLAQQGLTSTDPAFWKKSSNRSDVKMLLNRIRTLTNQPAPRTSSR